MAEAARLGFACRDCGAEVGDALACPRCRALVHADELNRLAAEANRAEREQRWSDALASWRTALDKLPRETKQYAHIVARVQQLSRRVDQPITSSNEPSPSAKRPMGRVGGALGAAGLVLWKLKTVALLAWGHLKLLLFGLGKAGSLLSMGVTLWLYARMWGVPYAIGIVLSLYVHEVGHVAALRRFGIEASAPMFVPGLGAFVRLKQYPVEPREDARVGLAGPIWGLGAALVAWGLGAAANVPVATAVAYTGASLNLFNLLPVWQLDGSRGFRAMNRVQRIVATAILVAAALLTQHPMLYVVAIGAAVRVFERTQPIEGDTRTVVEYVGLVVMLAAIAAVAHGALPTR